MYTLSNICLEGDQPRLRVIPADIIGKAVITTFIIPNCLPYEMITIPQIGGIGIRGRWVLGECKRHLQQYSITCLWMSTLSYMHVLRDTSIRTVWLCDQQHSILRPDEHFKIYGCERWNPAMQSFNTSWSMKDILRVGGSTLYVYTMC